MRKFLLLIIGAIVLALAGFQFYKQPNIIAIKSARSDTEAHLKSSGLVKGSPVFIRIFKQESLLELWMKKKGKWVLYKGFPVCYWSGKLGPKLKEGDHQSPEGFYRVTKSSLNPHSKYYLSFNLGYPNKYDRQHRRTGSYLMVHGNCVSIGCYAMTDGQIDVIYSLVAAALKNGQAFVPVHIFPFRMSEKNMKENSRSEWIGFWQNLKTGYDYFETRHQVPKITVTNKRYQVGG